MLRDRFAQDDNCFAQDENCFVQDENCFARDDKISEEEVPSEFFLWGEDQARMD
jgi:hypothetical protein